MREETALMLIDTRTASIKQKKSSALVVNLIGGPCAGKSKVGLLLTAKLKQLGLRAEYVSEVAKDYVYKKDTIALDGSMRSQTKMLIEQSKRIDLPYFSQMVDIVVLDSPLLLNTIYNKDATNEYIQSVNSLSRCYNNLFFFIDRNDKFTSSGRKQKNIKECVFIDNQIKDLFKKLRIKYTSCDDENIDKIIKQIIKHGQTKTTKKSTKKKQKTA